MCAIDAKTFVLLLVVSVISQGAATSTTTFISSTGNVPTLKPSDSHYRFHYMARADKTGGYQVQEDDGSRDSATAGGSNKVAEDNGDLRDAITGSKASIHYRDSATGIPPATGPYQNYRTGISAPPKTNRKPARGFNPIVVKSIAPQPIPPAAAATTSLPSPTLDHSQPPYAFYKERQNDSTTSVVPTNKPIPSDSIFHNSTTEIPAHTHSISQSQESKSIIVTNAVNKSYNLQSLSYLDHESDNNGTKSTNIITESTTLGRPTFTPQHTRNDLYQLRNADIPSSIMEILSQHKSQTVSHPDAIATSGTSITPKETAQVSGIPVSMPKIDSLESDASKWLMRDNLPQRPMRLIGLNPIYMDNFQLQSIAENLSSSIPQLHIEALSNIQYAAPIPLHWEPLTDGPAGPFHNTPRSVNEPNSEISYINTMSYINSIPISAPIIPPQALPAADFKSDLKSEKNKPAPFPLCNDCLMPTNYIPYPLVKTPMPGAAVTPIGGPAPSGNQKTPCPSNTAPAAGSAAPLWPPHTPSIAYILMPTTYIKDKINETRPLSGNAY